MANTRGKKGGSEKEGWIGGIKRFVKGIFGVSAPESVSDPIDYNLEKLSKPYWEHLEEHKKFFFAARREVEDLKQAEDTAVLGTYMDIQLRIIEEELAFYEDGTRGLERLQTQKEVCECIKDLDEHHKWIEKAKSEYMDLSKQSRENMPGNSLDKWKEDIKAARAAAKKDPGGRRLAHDRRKNTKKIEK